MPTYIYHIPSGIAITQQNESTNEVRYTIGMGCHTLDVSYFHSTEKIVQGVVINTGVPARYTVDELMAIVGAIYNMSSTISAALLQCKGKLEDHIDFQVRATSWNDIHKYRKAGPRYPMDTISPNE